MSALSDGLPTYCVDLMNISIQDVSRQKHPWSLFGLVVFQACLFGNRWGLLLSAHWQQKPLRTLWIDLVMAAAWLGVLIFLYVYVKRKSDRSRQFSVTIKDVDVKEAVQHALIEINAENVRDLGILSPHILS